MAKYQISCWLFGALECGIAGHQSLSKPQNRNQLTFDSSRTPATEIVVSCDASSQDGTGQTLLGADVVLDGVEFPAGSRIVAQSHLTGLSNPQQSVVIGTIQTQSEMISEPLIFATGSIDPREKFVPSGTHLPNEILDQASFARGTTVETPHGPINIEDLEDGDEVMTPDGDIQLITGLKRMRFSGLDLAMFPSLIPVRITAGALTGGRPGLDLLVTQDHRLVVDDWRAAYLFGEDEILVPAKSLLNGKSVVLEEHHAGIEYFQIAVENSDLVCANGLWAETSVMETTLGEVVDFGADHGAAIPALPRHSASALVA